MAVVDVCTKLGEQLVSEPIKHANNCVVLLKKISDEKSSEEESKSAIRALAVFFQQQLSTRNLQLSKNKKVAVERQATFEAWLRRQVQNYLTKLTSCISSTGPTSVKVAALAAIMDLCRASPQQSFAAGPLTQALVAMIASDSAQDVLQVYTTAYLQYADVRYYTWRVIHALVQAKLDTSTKERKAYENLKGVSEEIVATRVYSLLCASPALAGNKKQRTSIEDAQNIQNGSEDGSEENALKSWCQSTEASRISNQSEGAQRRRKRRRLENDKVAAESEPENQKSAKWMTPAFQKRAFSDAWLSFMRLQIPPETFRKVTVKLHEDVIPFLSNPLQLADLLGRALDAGGMLGMTALHAIFILVTKHGLEYPQFYARLYQLLKPEVFYAKFRTRFFQLADIFLSSPLVPAYTVASFIKRFSRLGLFAPPAGALVCVGFVHNLLRRHPACLVMLDRQDATGDNDIDRIEQNSLNAEPSLDSSMPINQTNGKAVETKPVSETNGVLPHKETNGAASRKEKKRKLRTKEIQEMVSDGIATMKSDEKSGNSLQHLIGADPFLEYEDDPAITRALESSLWELKSLSNHYYNQVSAVASQTFAKDLQDKKKTAELDMSTLIGGSYSRLTSNELSRRLKQIPVAFYQTAPQKLLDSSTAADFPGWEI